MSLDVFVRCTRIIMTTQKLLFIEDDHRIGEAVRHLLADAPYDLTLAGTGHEGLALHEALKPNVCLVDMGLPDQDGSAVIRELLRRDPALTVIVVSVLTARDDVMRALRAGAVGYILKEDLGTRLRNAIDEALNGGAPMSPRIARLVLREVKGDGDGRAQDVAGRPVPLTSREIEVLQALARGLSYADVACCLDISANTVRSHVRSIYEKLAVATKTEAVLEALRLGVIRN